MSEPNDIVDGGPGHGGEAWPEAAVPTGDPAVDAVLRRLQGIPAGSVGEHVALYEGIHDELVTVLDSDPSVAPAATSQAAPSQAAGFADEGGA